MSKRSGAARLIVFLVAGAALTYYLLSRSGSVAATVRGIMDSLSGADPVPLSAGFLLFFVSQLIRAWRWKLLSADHSIALSMALPYTSVHVGLGHILPVRLSDVALVGMFRRYSSIPAGAGASTVMLAKVMDMIAIGSVVAMSFLTGVSGPVIPVAIAVAILGIASLFALPGILTFLGSPIRKLFGDQSRTWNAWSQMAASIRITADRRRTASTAMGASFAAWAAKLFMFWFLLESIGVVGLPLWQVFTACAVTDLTMALPVHGLLSLGTVEAGWVAGFALTGITGVLPGGLTVVEAGFTVHLLWLFMALLLMLAGIVALVPVRKRVKP